ncbi:MAG: hypothetical protein U0L05_08225 [Schaedlerella sp.]|nr:hypothetical protein [Schaedlerella sp.]
MIRLEVITAEKNNNMIFNPVGTTLELADFYRQKMAEAADAHQDILYLDGIPFEEKRSMNFQNIGILEKCIMDYLQDHEFPKKVCIICDSDEKTELYKVVYNFYYPEIEDDKLDDDRWN